MTVKFSRELWVFASAYGTGSARDETEQAFGIIWMTK